MVWGSNLKKKMHFYILKKKEINYKFCSCIYFVLQAPVFIFMIFTCCTFLYLNAKYEIGRFAKIT